VKELKIDLDNRCASFETAASRPPQDEAISIMRSGILFMLRNAQWARLEARTTAIRAAAVNLTKYI
jgi:hypothetical protein